MRNKLLVTVLIIVLLLGGGAAYYLIKNKDLNSSAQVATPTMSIQPANGTYSVGDFFNATIQVDSAGQVVNGGDAYINYNPAELEIQDADTNKAGVQISTGAAFDSYIMNSVDPSAGKIVLSGLVNVGTQKAVSGIAGTVRFKVLAQAGSSAVTFDFTRGSTSGTVLAVADLETGVARNILDSATGATYVLRQAAAVPTLDLKADGSNGPILKNQNETAVITWVSTNVDSCVASGAWSGNKSAAGQETTGSLTGSTIYILTCKNTDWTVEDSVVVNVSVPNTTVPQIDLKANGSSGAISVESGSAVKLSWTVSDATTCSASGDWAGSKNLTGEETTGTLDSAKTYILTCQGDVGASDSVTVNISSQSGAGDTNDTGSGGTSTDNSDTGSTATSTTTQTATATATPSKLTPSTSPRVSKLPSNIQPATAPQVQESTVELYKNDSMKPWALWFLYAIIPAFLAGGAIFVYLKRKREQKNTEII